MAAQVLTNVGLWFGSVDLAPFSGAIDTQVTVDMKTANNFAAGGFRIQIPGFQHWVTKIDGNADFASGAPGATFTPAARGTQYPLTIVPNGTAASAGDPCILQRGIMSMSSQLRGNVGDVAQFSLGLESDTAGLPGVVLAPMASRTTSGLTGTAVNLTGPTASQLGYAALHVTAASGTNLVVKVQSDDNSGFTSPTDRITFSTVSAVGWQWGTTTAAALTGETYWRVLATIATGTFTFGVSFGVF